VDKKRQKIIKEAFLKKISGDDYTCPKCNTIHGPQDCEIQNTPKRPTLPSEYQKDFWK